MKRSFPRVLKRSEQKFTTSQLVFELLPEKFTLTQLQHLYEVILNKKLDSGISERRC